MILDLTFIVADEGDRPEEVVCLADDQFRDDQPRRRPLTPAGEAVPAASITGLPIIARRRARASCVENGLLAIGPNRAWCFAPRTTARASDGAVQGWGTQ